MAIKKQSREEIHLQKPTTNIKFQMLKEICTDTVILSITNCLWKTMYLVTSLQFVLQTNVDNFVVT